MATKEGIGRALLFEQAAPEFSSHCCLHGLVLFQSMLRLIDCIAFAFFQAF
jgi:hypothetical protein